jgi:predicted enzyme related to lactoylglutathione lyase
MKDDLKRHGNFSLTELLTTDLSSAKKFYGELLGWTFTETKNIYGKSYITILREGDVVGGMMLKQGIVPDEVPPIWDTYVSVDDVDASAIMVEKLGGQVVVPPTDIPDVGRFCVIKDPQGASLNLIMYADKES